jgi:hypothetical protein
MWSEATERGCVDRNVRERDRCREVWRLPWVARDVASLSRKEWSEIVRHWSRLLDGKRKVDVKTAAPPWWSAMAAFAHGLRACCTIVDGKIYRFYDR